MLEIVAEWMTDWQAYLGLETLAETMRRLRLHGRTGRPLGSDSFIARLEKLLGRPLRPGKPGRPRKGKNTKQYTAPKTAALFGRRSGSTRIFIVRGRPERS